MSISDTPPPRRSGVGRLVLVAAVGAAAVLGYQALTAGGGHPRSHAGPPASAVASAETGASRRQGVTASSANGHAATTEAKGATGAARLARPAAVTGPRLVVVIDEPSAPFAQQNRLIMQGATVALAQLNAVGGAGHHGVSLVPEQLDGLSPTAVQQRLHAAGPGAVLVLPCDTNSQFSLAGGAAPYRTLMFAPCDADAALAQTIPTYWPVGMSGNDEAAGLADFMQRIGYSSVYVVNTPGLTFAAAMTRYFREAVQAQQLRIAGSATVSMALTSAAIQHLAAGIKAARPRPTAVFSALPPPYVGQLAAGLLRDGVHAILLGTSAMDTPLTLGASVSALSNATFPTYGFLSQDAAANGFLAEYRARFGLPIGSFPGLGYETIRLLEAAVDKARSTDPSAIQAALLGGLSLAGVALADRSYAGSDHNPTSTVSVEKISSGSFLPLLTSPPTDAPAP